MPFGWGAARSNTQISDPQPRKRGDGGLVEEAKKVEAWPSYEAEWLKKRLQNAANNPKSKYYTDDMGAVDNAQKYTYLDKVSADYREEADAALKAEFVHFLHSQHEVNLKEDMKVYQNDGTKPRRMEILRGQNTQIGSTKNDWQIAPWGKKPLYHLKGVRDFLCEMDEKAAKDELDMNILAEYGPQSLEEAWMYFKHWVKGRPVALEESPLDADIHPKPRRPYRDQYTDFPDAVDTLKGPPPPSGTGPDPNPRAPTPNLNPGYASSSAGSAPQTPQRTEPPPQRFNTFTPEPMETVQEEDPPRRGQRRGRSDGTPDVAVRSRTDISEEQAARENAAQATARFEQEVAARREQTQREAAATEAHRADDLDNPYRRSIEDMQLMRRAMELAQSNVILAQQKDVFTTQRELNEVEMQEWAGRVDFSVPIENWQGQSLNVRVGQPAVQMPSVSQLPSQLPEADFGGLTVDGIETEIQRLTGEVLTMEAAPSFPNTKEGKEAYSKYKVAHGEYLSRIRYLQAGKQAMKHTGVEMAGALTIDIQEEFKRAAEAAGRSLASGQLFEIARDKTPYDTVDEIKMALEQMNKEVNPQTEAMYVMQKSDEVKALKLKVADAVSRLGYGMSNNTISELNSLVEGLDTYESEMYLRIGEMAGKRINDLGSADEVAAAHIMYMDFLMQSGHVKTPKEMQAIAYGLKKSAFATPSESPELMAENVARYDAFMNPFLQSAVDGNEELYVMYHHKAAQFNESVSKAKTMEFNVREAVKNTNKLRKEEPEKVESISRAEQVFIGEVEASFPNSWGKLNITPEWRADLFPGEAQLYQEFVDAIRHNYKYTELQRNSRGANTTYGRMAEVALLGEYVGAKRRAEAISKHILNNGIDSVLAKLDKDERRALYDERTAGGIMTVIDELGSKRHLGEFRS